MADKGFNMPPSQRREPKRFEPPPWERDAFDELERKRMEAEQAGQPEAAADRPVAEQATEGQQTEGQASRAEAPGEADVEDQAAEGDGTEGENVEKPAPPKPGVEEKQVAAMLLELAAEEPKADSAISTITLAVAVVLFALGAMMIMWGMAGFVAARGAGGQAVAAAGVLFLFGAGFVAGGIYLAVKSLQKRGVL